ncbi:Purine-binding chemotaxis protein CheW [Gammaproteobacteria bacterium]
MNEPPSTLDAILATRREISSQILSVDEPTVQLVVFVLQGEWHAFHGDRIREILPYGTVHFIPGCPSSLEGVINVRGDIASVICLETLFGRPNTLPSRNTAILLGQGGGMESGIRVDEVVDVLEIPVSAIQAPPATLPDPLRPLALGVFTCHDRPVMVLNLDRLFEDYRRGLG